MNNTLLIITLLFSGASFAGVYKCTDSSGNTRYQSSPCADHNQAFEMNTKTGTAVDLNQLEQQQALEAQEKLRLQQERQLHLKEIEQRNQAAIAESQITQDLIKNNPTQYSAFAIPAYDPENLSPLVQKFSARLPEIEKMRRLAALQALSGDLCHRVEGDELDEKSTIQQLIIRIGCGSGKNLYFTESELTQ